MGAGLRWANGTFLRDFLSEQLGQRGPSLDVGLVGPKYAARRAHLRAANIKECGGEGLREAGIWALVSNHT